MSQTPEIIEERNRGPASEPIDGSLLVSGAPLAAALEPAGGCGCSGGAECSCGTTGSLGYVYAIGSVTARFPSLNIEKEFLQAWGKPLDQTLRISDADKFSVLSQGQSLYLTREMCWVFQSGDIDLFILQPRSYVELTDLVTCLSPTPGLVSYALIVGTLGSTAPPALCNGAQLPVVTCNQIFSFTVGAFINSIVLAVKNDETLMTTITTYVNALDAAAPPAGSAPTPTQISVDDFISSAANKAFGVLTILTDNAGQTDEHRAINYITFKSVALYKKVIELEIGGFTLNAVATQPDSLARTRQIEDVIFTFTSNTSPEVKRYFTRVDVSGQFPFLLNDIALFYEHP